MRWVLFIGGMVPSTPFFVAASDFFGELRVVVGGVEYLVSKENKKEGAIITSSIIANNFIE